MTENPSSSEPATGPVVTPEPARPVTTTVPVEQAPRERNRVTQAAAWVGIVAGVVFIVTVIFGTGFFLGAHSGGGDHHRGGHDRHGVMFHRGGPPMGPPHGMMPMGPGQFGQGGPGGPQFRGPSQPDRPEAPTPTSPARP
ncbi:hypothetical protein [Mycolicibacterium sp. XJ870]